jgi:hypothetical protein
MKANIQFTAGVIRCGPELHQYGDPYNFVCSFVVMDKSIYLYGAVGEYNRATFRAIMQILKADGFEKVEWEKKNISNRKVTVDL